MAFGLLAVICVTRSLINERLNYMDYWGKYNGPLTVLMAVFLFVWFKNLRIKENGLVCFVVRLAPYSLGVYLIHEHPLVRGILWRSVSGLWSDNAVLLIPSILLSGVFVYLLCTIMDWLRERLFSLLAVNRSVEKITFPVVEKIIRKLCR